MIIISSAHFHFELLVTENYTQSMLKFLIQRKYSTKHKVTLCLDYPVYYIYLNAVFCFLGKKEHLIFI